MKKVIAFLTLLGLVLICWFGWNWYKSNIICCNQSTEQEIINTLKPELVTTSKDPLIYSWDSSNAITNKDWDAKKQEIISTMKDGSILSITGPYFADETNNSTFKNLGLARADAARMLFSGEISTENIEISSKLVDYYDGAKTQVIPLTQIDWRVKNDNIKEVEGKVLIYFPNASSKKLDNKNINDYLKDVASNLKSNSKKVSITGHTDNTGRASGNMKLGLRRANSIKNVLILHGVSKDRIIVATKGMNEPIDTNDTSEGRQKNRRVELIITE